MLISVIIPIKDASRRENIKTLLSDIYNQDVDAQIEACEVVGVSPSGRARNNGANKAKGDIFIFIDDDIGLAHREIFKNMIRYIVSDENVGACGISQLIPKESNLFQRLCARDISHVERPVVEEPQEVKMVNGGCFAVRRDVFFKIGRFNEKLVRGVDVEFCARIKSNNYKIILAPDSWVYHPPPRNIIELIKLSFRNGRATAFADRYFPELIFDIGLNNLTYALARKSKASRLWRYISEIIKSIIFLRFTNLIYKIAYIFGYFCSSVFSLNNNV